MTPLFDGVTGPLSGSGLDEGVTHRFNGPEIEDISLFGGSAGGNAFGAGGSDDSAKALNYLLIREALAPAVGFPGGGDASPPQSGNQLGSPALGRSYRAGAIQVGLEFFEFLLELGHFAAAECGEFVFEVVDAAINQIRFHRTGRGVGMGMVYWCSVTGSHFWTEKR